MNIQTITNPLNFVVYGLSAKAVNKDYMETAFRFSGKMWETIKQRGWKNQGKNVWMYEADDMVFTGVELDEVPADAAPLECRLVRVSTYAYYKHTGPYQGLKKAGLQMRQEILAAGHKLIAPYIEIYGHWNSDANKLETELIMAIE